MSSLGFSQDTPEQVGDVQQWVATPGLQTDQGTPVVVVDQTVPVAETWNLWEVKCSCRAYGKLEVTVDDVVVGAVVTSADESNPTFSWAPKYPVAGGAVVKAIYTQSHGPVTDLAVFLSYRPFTP